MEKRKKKEVRKSSKKSESIREDLKINTQSTLKFLSIENCISVHLSLQTQQYIECVIDEHVTAEEPWIYVKKEKIEDSLYLYEENSEFFPIKDLVEEYPDKMMLIGSYGSKLGKTVEFIICTTDKAKLTILELLAQDKAAIKEKVKNFICCQPKEWKSLGSEVEVEGSQNKDIRSLFEVVYDSKLPITNVKVNFQYRFASLDPTIRTYEEIIPDNRFNRKLIFRVRIDRASQIAPKRHSIQSQTNLPYPKYKYTQTNEVFVVLELSDKENNELHDNLNKIQEFMEDSLLVNFHINLYMNDYEFPDAYIQSYGREAKELISFQDVRYCKNLYQGSTSWNALISGLIAVSYVKISKKLIVNEKYLSMKSRAFASSLHDDNMVLLWCYTNHLSPKLYIHADFEITSISFCPYDADILVGGGSGGQIVLWDLRNKLKEVETKEYLTPLEQNHRNHIQVHTTWIKDPPGVRHVFPTIISDINASHKSSVISIQWLPSYQCLTKLGQVENMPALEDPESYLDPSKSYQFLTCSLEDSCLFAWEIKHSFRMLQYEKISMKKTRRLSRLPESIEKGVSPLKKFNKGFQPFFKFKLEIPGAKSKRIIVTEFILNNPRIEYMALNPQTLNQLKERTYFKEIVPEERKAHTQQYFFCSTSGYLADCHWMSNEFDQGQTMNDQICVIKVFPAVHDGPILSCRSNTFYPECILTVGGSVFAIWITSTNKKPIFWRKSSCRLVSGIWSLQYPLLCLILREDNFMEYWDLIECSTTPLRKVKLKGNQIIDVIVDSTKSHARKKTYLLTDIKGAIRIQDRAVFNKLLSIEEMRTITVDILKNMLMRKEHVENLSQQLMKMHNLTQLHDLVAPLTDTQPPAGAKSEVFQNEVHHQIRTTAWQRQKEQLMYETLLQQKKIDLDDLKQNKIKLMDKLNERIELQKKLDQILALKEEIFDKHKKYLLETTNITRRQKISVSFPEEMESIVKQWYVDDYKLMEMETLGSIGKSPYRCTLTWGGILGRRKSEHPSKVKKPSVVRVRNKNNMSID